MKTRERTTCQSAGSCRASQLAAMCWAFACFSASYWTTATALGAEAGPAGSPAKKPPATVVTWPAPHGEGSIPMSDRFALRINGRPVDVYCVRVLKPHTWAGDWGPQQYLHAAMAYFDFEGTVDVEIQANVPVNSVRVRPLSAGIQARCDGNAVRFLLDRPRQLSIEINEDSINNLQLFANPIEKSAPKEGDPNVRFFGPGVHFPADDGIQGAIKLQSNETIYIARGAVVHGAIQTPHHETIHDVTIRGRGILLGERDTENKRGLIKIGYSCKNVAIRDINLLDSYGWVIEVAWANDVLIDNVKIIAYRGNSDGIDIASCSDVVVRNCYIRSADDSLVVVNVRYDPSMKNFHQGAEGYRVHYGMMFKWPGHKAGKQGASNIVFRDCVLWQDRDDPDAIHVGWSMVGPEVRDVRFENIDVVRTRGGPHTDVLDVDTSWWGDKGNVIRNILFEDIRVEDAKGGHLIRIHQKNEPATIKDLVFRNVYVVEGNLRTASVDVKSAGGLIENVVFENIRVFGKKVGSLKELGVSLPLKRCEGIVVK